MSKKTNITDVCKLSGGELLLLRLKAIQEGCNLSELTRKAIDAYQPTPRSKGNICMSCPGVKVSNEMRITVKNKEFELDVAGVKRKMVVKDIPCQECDECGNITTNLSLMVDIEDAIDRLFVESIKNENALPAEITIEDLVKSKTKYPDIRELL